jgi:uncharacterized protein YhfF
MIGDRTPEVEAFWTKVCKQHGISTNEYHSKTFGDPKYAEYGNHVTELAIAETKRATAHLAMDFELNNVKRRETGDYWVILWEDFSPACVLHLVNVEVRLFKDVDAAFAAREGEGDGSLEFWKQVHEDYFKLQLADWGKNWSDELPVVLESFDLLMVNES